MLASPVLHCVSVCIAYMQDEVYVSQLERLCDAVVRVESFTGSDKEQNPLYQDYHGKHHNIMTFSTVSGLSLPYGTNCVVNVCRSLSLGEVAMSEFYVPSSSRDSRPCLQTEKKKVFH